MLQVLLVFPGENSSTLEELAERLCPSNEESATVATDKTETHNKENSKDKDSTGKLKEESESCSTEKGNGETDGKTAACEFETSESGT